MSEETERDIILYYSLQDGESAKRLWDYVAEHRKLSALDRARIEAMAAAMCSSFEGAMHSATGWCGDMVPENHTALWPIFALMQVEQGYGEPWKVSHEARR